MIWPELPGFDLRADALIPRRVTLLNKGGKAPVRPDRGGGFQRPGIRFDSENVPVEQVFRLEGFAAASRQN